MYSSVNNCQRTGIFERSASICSGVGVAPARETALLLPFVRGVPFFAASFVIDLAGSFRILGRFFLTGCDTGGGLGLRVFVDR